VLTKRLIVNASGQKVRTRPPQGAQPQAKINELQKQQKRTAEFESTVARLAAAVKEQAAQIQKVNAQLEASRPAAQVVANR
jgi:primosomal protein N''